MISFRELGRVGCALVALFGAVPAAGQEVPARTLFENVMVFDGVSEARTGPLHVLAEGDRIARISEASPEVAGDAVRVIDGTGRTLMPGLIDAHVHMMMSTIPISVLMTADPTFGVPVAGRGAGEMLMRGFTSVRDMGGPTFGLKRAIDEGQVAGPRIWPLGATISQTSGHGDFRVAAHDLPAGGVRPLHFTERLGYTAVVDGRAEVLRAVREQLMQGASQIKVMAGGGVASDYDPLDVTQFTADEMRAAVEAPAGWNTYVTVHAYTPAAMQQAISAGVRSIEHGQLADAETARMMAENDVWWSMQPFLDDEDATPFPEGSLNRMKQLTMTSGTDRAYALAKEHGVKLAWGTDSLFDPALTSRQGRQLAKMERWFTPAEALRMATGTNGELLTLAGARSPYPGPVGVVAEGALADLLLVEGDPLADLSLVAHPETAFVVIMKGGVIHKDMTAP